MNNLAPLLMEGLREHNIPAPYRTSTSNGFMRWGKSNEYWAREIGDGYAFGDWKQGSKYLIFPNNRSKLTQEENETLKRIQQEDKQRKLNEAREKAKEGKRIFDSLPNADLNHPYLICKGIRQIPDDIRQLKKNLAIPIYNIYGEMISMQFIAQNGQKRYLSGARKQGGFYVIGAKIKDGDPICLCEGVATGLSLYAILGLSIVVAFDSGNLTPVAINLRRKYPNSQIIVAADNDCKSIYNTGIEKAKEASSAIDNATIMYPVWIDKNSRQIKQSVDWNDIYVEHNNKEESNMVKKKIEMSLKMGNECVKFYTQSAKKAKEDRIYNKENKNGI